MENVADVVEKVAGVAEKEYEKLPIHGKLRNSGIYWVFRVFLKNNICLKIYQNNIFFYFKKIIFNIKKLIHTHLIKHLICI